MGGNMGFLQYLMLGGLAYGCGFAVRYYAFGDKKGTLTLNKTKIYQATFGFFLVMLPIAWAINQWILQKSTPDFAFIVVCSLVTTFIFYQGVAVDKNHQVPD